MDKTINKEAIIAEYLVGGTTYRELHAKHGISFQTIHQWVQSFVGKTKTSKIAADVGQSVLLPKEEPLPVEVKQLQKELHKSKLENKLLNAMIDIAEEQLKIGIRKKSGAKRS